MFNFVIDLEEIPFVQFIKGVVYTDPLIASNYRGIKMTSVLSKVLENLILSRLEPTLIETGFPHQQSAGMWAVLMFFCDPRARVH